jgi:hypothetical protein
VTSFGSVCFVAAGLLDGYDTQVLRFPDLVFLLETATEDSKVFPKD